MVIELRFAQFWSEIILVISDRTRAGRSIDFEITRMISAQIALHSVQLPLYKKKIPILKDKHKFTLCLIKIALKCFVGCGSILSLLLRS